jgi:hypothetical protein
MYPRIPRVYLLFWALPYISGSQSVVPGPAAELHPGSCYKCKFSGPILALLSQKLGTRIQDSVFLVHKVWQLLQGVRGNPNEKCLGWHIFLSETVRSQWLANSENIKGCQPLPLIRDNSVMLFRLVG